METAGFPDLRVADVLHRYWVRAVEAEILNRAADLEPVRQQTYAVAVADITVEGVERHGAVMTAQAELGEPLRLPDGSGAQRAAGVGGVRLGAQIAVPQQAGFVPLALLVVRRMTDAADFLGAVPCSAGEVMDAPPDALANAGHCRCAERKGATQQRRKYFFGFMLNHRSGSGVKLHSAMHYSCHAAAGSNLCRICTGSHTAAADATVALRVREAQARV